MSIEADFYFKRPRYCGHLLLSTESIEPGFSKEIVYLGNEGIQVSLSPENDVGSIQLNDPKGICVERIRDKEENLTILKLHQPIILWTGDLVRVTKGLKSIDFTIEDMKLDSSPPSPQSLNAF